MRTEHKAKFDFLEQNGCEIKEGKFATPSIYAVREDKKIGAQFHGNHMSIDSFIGDVSKIFYLVGWQSLTLDQFKLTCIKNGLIEDKPEFASLHQNTEV